jgi:type IV secretory pathway TrbL component
MQWDPKVGWALVLAVFLESAAALMWAGRAAERISGVERELTALDRVGERLARAAAVRGREAGALGD